MEARLQFLFVVVFHRLIFIYGGLIAVIAANCNNEYLIFRKRSCDLLFVAFLFLSVSHLSPKRRLW